MDFTTQRILFNAAGSGGTADAGYAIYVTSNGLAQDVSVFLDNGKDRDVYFGTGNVIARYNPDGTLVWSVAPNSWSASDPFNLQSDNNGVYAYSPRSREIVAISTSSGKRWSADYYTNVGVNSGESFTNEGTMVLTPGYCALTMGARPGPNPGIGANQYPLAWYGSVYSSYGGRPLSLNGASYGDMAWYFRGDANRSDNANIYQFKSAPDPSLGGGVISMYYSYEVNKISFFRWTAYSTTMRSAKYLGTTASNIALCSDSIGNAFLGWSVYGGSYYGNNILKLDPSDNQLWVKYIYISGEGLEVEDAASDDDYVYFVCSGTYLRIIKVDASTGDLVKAWKIICTQSGFQANGESYISLGKDHIYFTLPNLGFAKILKDEPVLGTFGNFTVEEDPNVQVSGNGFTIYNLSPQTTTPPNAGPRDPNNPQYGDEYYNNLMQLNSTTINPQTRGWQTIYFE